ncbi:hypothetical protein VOLCADRAFT_87834 [Volvox carteri f. nagariensis]|uniref:Uncharacterized protein n=1 Tax=Volvox carteri f. nagariensis TaxID=3068 RepID=D8TMD3_VOLCA|nr:uncharacterized protein VOLCADRAFT_87834 [Volvox carteri f. nagariensis]EFJ51482.1 hypothetical protein VOLCADRAFT_87834 [Volvox carteri f. nagariensis]|eukprot:XP_002947434.1 hypothetical protein VOLCADRAFT_87834 [Volvox carteri f. nagariensis]
MAGCKTNCGWPASSILCESEPTVTTTLPRAILSPDEARTAAMEPFLVIRNTKTASSKEVHQLYNQATIVSYIAYPLFCAAKPLAESPAASLIAAHCKSLEAPIIGQSNCTNEQLSYFIE